MKRFPLAALVLGCGVSAACTDDETVLPSHCGIAFENAAHACLHGRAGPFVALTSALSGAPARLEQLHTLYTVGLAPMQDSHFGGRVSFRPKSAGLWGIFVDPAAPFSAETPEGKPLPWELTTTATHCASFATAHVLRLEAEQEIHFVVQHAETPFVRVLPERLGGAWPQALETVGCDAVLADGGRAPTDGGSDAHVNAPVPAPDLAPAPDGAAGDAGRSEPDAAQPFADAASAPMCRTEGPCTRDDECCAFCHDQDHCH